MSPLRYGSTGNNLWWVSFQLWVQKVTVSFGSYRVIHVGQFDIFVSYYLLRIFLSLTRFSWIFLDFAWFFLYIFDDFSYTGGTRTAWFLSIFDRWSFQVIINRPFIHHFLTLRFFINFNISGGSIPLSCCFMINNFFN